MEVETDKHTQRHKNNQTHTHKYHDSACPRGRDKQKSSITNTPGVAGAVL